MVVSGEITFTKLIDKRLTHFRLKIVNAYVNCVALYLKLLPEACNFIT
jgi:hypothetical protein